MSETYYDAGPCKDSVSIRISIVLVYTAPPLIRHVEQMRPKRQDKEQHDSSKPVMLIAVFLNFRAALEGT